MKKSLIVLVLSFLSFAAIAQGNSGGYFSLGGGLLTFDDGVDSIEPKQIMARLGYDFNPYIGVGFEGGFSLIEDDLQGVDFDVSTVFFYLRGNIPLGNGGRIYGLIGPANTELTASAGSVSVAGDDDDTAMGFGFEFPVTTGAMFVDYITYFDDNDVDVTSINIGYTGRF